MRIESLSLQRYGHFTDFTLDFGAGKSATDLHIVYGGNEAGKTTAFNALLDLLFGIPKISPYAFLHERKALCIGVGLRHQDIRHDWVRTGQGLRDSEGQPVNPARLTAVSAGLSRTAWVSMFSLDDDTLERGGDEILASRGDIGSLLFSASSGITGLHQRLDELGSEHDDFYHPRKQKLAIRTLIDSIRDAGKQLRALDDSIALQKRLRAELDQLDQSIGDNESETHDLHRQRQSIESRLRAIDAVQRYQRHQSALAPLRSLPDVPEQWLDDGAALLDRVTRADSERHFQQSALTESEARCASLPEPDPVLEIGDDVTALLEDWRHCRVLSAQEAENDSRRRGLQARIHVLCDSLSIDTSVQLPAWLSDAQRLQRLQALRDAGQPFPALEGLAPPPDTTALQSLLEQVRASAESSRLAELLEQRAQAASRLDAVRRSLLPWQGDIDTLAALPLPDAERLAQWQQRYRQLKDALTDCQERARRADEAIAESQHRLDTLRAQSDWMDPDEQTSRRHSADGLWQAHAGTVRELLAGKDVGDRLASTLDAFDRAWQTLVLNETLRQSQVDAWANYRTELSQRHSHERSRDALLDDAAKHQAELALLQQSIDDVAGSIARGSGTDLSELMRFLNTRSDTLDAASSLAALDARIAVITGKRQQHAVHLASLAEKTLGDALPGFETPRDSEHLDELIREVSDRLSATEQHGQRLRQALDDLIAAANECLRLDDAHQRVGTLNEQCRRHLDAIQHRIGRLEGADLTAQITQLEARLADARQQATVHARETAQRDERRQALDKLLHDTDVLLREYADRNRLLGTSDTASQRLALDRLRERQHLQNELTDAANTLCDVLQVATVDEGLAMMQAHDKHSLLAEQVRVQEALQSNASHRDTLLEERQRIRQELSRIGSDDAAARLQEHIANQKVELQERSEAVLRQRLGVAAVREALRQYQDTHRSSMMLAASQAFRTLSGGHFTDLDIQPGAKGEVLYAIKSNGQSIQAGQMSKGTRFQLYLALRIAGYREFAAAGDPPPFIADDIMETFDDARAKLALTEFAELSGTGQIIYLTHHRHIVELARNTLGDAVQVHELPRPPHSPDRRPHSTDT